MNIRRAAYGDLPVIADIHVDSWRSAYRGVLPQDFLGDPIAAALSQHWQEVSLLESDVVLVAEKGGPIGFIAVWCRPAPYIDNLHVRPQLRSRGIGSALMQSAAEALVGLGHRSAWLWVFASNVKAIRFYERLGGVQTQRGMQTVFGYRVPSVKIEWQDLALVGKG